MDDVEDMDRILEAVGPRLRALRQQREMTLADLSADTGISVSTLSRLESGQRRPTLELLLPLARAYGVPLDELVGAPPTGDPRIHASVHAGWHDDHAAHPATGWFAGVQARHSGVTGRQEPDPRVHEGYEWLYVLSGTTSAGARRARPRDARRARRPSSTRASRTGSGPPTRTPSSS